MTVGEIIKAKDRNTYCKLLKMCSKPIEGSNKKIELGCSVIELMRSDSYRREGRRIKQRGWGSG